MTTADIRTEGNPVTIRHNGQGWITAPGTLDTAISANGAVTPDLKSCLILITTTGASTGSLGSGRFRGDTKIFGLVSDGGDYVLTLTTAVGPNTVTLNDVGDSCTVMWTGAAWLITSNQGCTLATV